VSTPLAQADCGSLATATASRVLYAIGRAHGMLGRVRHYVRAATEPCLEQVLDWKDTRAGQFADQLPTHSNYYYYYLFITPLRQHSKIQADKQYRTHKHHAR